MKKIFMASVALVTLSLSIILFQTTSCTKTNAQNQSKDTTSILGLWTGTYTVDGEAGEGEQYFSFILKPDGTLINDTKGSGVQHLAIGTWSLNGNTLSCTTTCVYGSSFNIGIVEHHTSTFDSKEGTLTSGVWTRVSPVGSGTFSLTKVE